MPKSIQFLAQKTKSLALQVEKRRNILYCCKFYSLVSR